MSSSNNSNSFTRSTNSNKKYSGGDYFGHSSYLNKSEGKGYGQYEMNEENLYNMNNDIAYNILSSSKFIITVKYVKEKNEVSINYKEIICEDVKLKIESIKDFSAGDEDFDLKDKYEKFNKYLEEFEKELKNNYKKETETEIILEIKKKSDVHYDAIWKIIIDDEKEKQEKEGCFIDENFLETNTHNGLGCLIGEI